MTERTGDQPSVPEEPPPEVTEEPLEEPDDGNGSDVDEPIKAPPKPPPQRRWDCGVVESPLALHRTTPGELKVRLEVERRGRPFLVYRDEEGAERILELESRGWRVTIGRQSASDIALHWDTEVSRTHAELERIAGEWTAIDDGRSRNGTFINGVRLRGRRRLRDGDALRIGGTVLYFRAPSAGASLPTAASEAPVVPEIREAQRRVLIALCRPVAESALAAPASNPRIAEELHLSLDGVKTQMRSLFRAFGIGALPQNQKRAELARRALESGAVRVPDADG